jgi:hypothetical protein
VYRRRNQVYPFILVLLVILAFIGLWWASSRYAGQFPPGADFSTGWTAAKLWVAANTSPYAAGIAGEAQRLTGYTGPAFSYPYYAIFMFIPFSGLDYPTAHALWIALGIVAFIATIGLSLSFTGWKLSFVELALLILFSLFWYNGARIIVSGQMVVFLGLILMGALKLIQSKQDSGAGVLLAFSLVRPDLSLIVVVLVCIWSFMAHRRKVFLGFLAGTAFLVSVSLLLMPDWPLQWMRVLVNSTGRGDWYGSALSLVSRAIPGIQRPFSIFLNLAALLFLAIEWFGLRPVEDRSFVWASALALVMTTLIGFRVESVNAILLLPALFLIFRIWKERWGLPGQIMTWMCIFFASILSWIVILNSTALKFMPEPVGFLIVLPVITLIGLLWVRWWAVRAVRLPFEMLRDRIGY